jgi:NAD(P)-dependent dehydrogenase (short-subunit alcohol dehydrogenase family)
MTSDTSDTSKSRNRRWFVTGASSGLGRAIVERALADGDNVVAGVRKPLALRDLGSRYPNALKLEVLDVCDLAATSTTIARVLRSGPIDIVVNNAGYGVIGAAEEITEQQIDDQLRTLLRGPIAITRGFLPAMRRQKAGHIIQMSSFCGQVAVPAASMYSAAKWGLEGFSESVALEVKEFGIAVTIVEPGGHRTGFTKALDFAPPLAAYRDGPVAEFRRIAGAEDTYTGDPAEVASRIIEVTRMPEPPLRLVIGRDAYMAIDSSLHDRLRALSQCRESSGSIQDAI